MRRLHLQKRKYPSDTCKLPNLFLNAFDTSPRILNFFIVWLERYSSDLPEPAVLSALCEFTKGVDSPPTMVASAITLFELAKNHVCPFAYSLWLANISVNTASTTSPSCSSIPYRRHSSSIRDFGRNPCRSTHSLESRHSVENTTSRFHLGVEGDEPQPRHFFQRHQQHG